LTHSDFAGDGAARRFTGVFSDGQTAAGRQVELVFTREGLDISAEQDARLMFWSYSHLSSTGPLVAGQGANIGNQALPEARIYVTDPDFAALLLQRAPQLSSRAEHRRVLVPIYMMLAAMLVAGGLFWLSGWSPSHAIAGMIPDKVRKSLGDQVIAYMSGGRPACKAPKGAAALDKIMARLNTGLPRAQNYQVIVADLSMLNAFATPGERIMVSAKLIKFTDSPEELAGVLAHEMGHGLERHPETGIVRSVGLSALIDLFSGGSAGNIGKIGGFLIQMSYSRSAEREADAHAIRILRHAELPAAPLAAFFDKLEKKQAEIIKPGSGLDAALAILSTHPPLPERVKTIKKSAGYQTRPLLNKSQWKSLRGICGGGKGGKRDNTGEDDDE